MTDHSPDTLEMIVEVIIAIPTLLLAAYFIGGGIKEEIRRFFSMKTQKQLTCFINNYGYDAYLHAITKHPFFCDTICSDSQDWKALAKAIKEHIQFHALRRDGFCTGKDILDAEMAEVYDAIQQGDYNQARRELLDAFAVLMRMDDMLRAVDGQDAQPPLEEDCRQTDDFTQLVKEMRTMQKAFFRTREASTFQASKRLESEVDRRIADIEHEDKQHE